MAVAGALGTVSRYGLSELTHSVMGRNFPWGTLVINIAGCFVIGLLMTLFAGTTVFTKEMQMALTVGFLGAFTTFSAFSYDSFKFFHTGSWEMGMLNIIANVVIGLLAVMGGMGVARVIQ
ncbi:MAG: fluoride efflux transporter CrcB [Dehalococcoidales bacterium]|nr:fluoride efflux transporter CrcB [Dehalococcoidales bacterium]